MATANRQASFAVQQPMDGSQAGVADPRWQWLYKVGGVAALFPVLLVPVQLIVFTNVPEPTTADGWFTLFQTKKLLALLSFEILFVVNAAFGIATTLSLYVALRRDNESIMAVALTLSLIGAVCIIIARPAVDMLYLSDQYVSATSDTQKSLFLAAGEGMIALRHGTAFHVSYNLANIVLILIPLVMLSGHLFSRATAYMGILSGVIGFGLYIPTVGVYVSVLSVLFYAVYLILVARKLFHLGRAVPQG